MRSIFSMAAILLAGACTVESRPQDQASRQTVVTFDGGQSADAAARVAHGQRLGDVLGCSTCHSANYQGGNFQDDEDSGTVYASNLTRRVPDYSDAQLRALLSEGVLPGRSNLWYMPAKNLQRLSEPDLAALIAFLRTLEPKGEDWPMPKSGEATQVLLDIGVLESSAVAVEAYRQNPPVDLGPQFAKGRYIGSVVCAECHGADLSGGSRGAPGLDMVAGYDLPAFKKLLREGKKFYRTGGRTMRILSQRSLSRLTDEEIASLHAYLQARANDQLPE